MSIVLSLLAIYVFCLGLAQFARRVRALVRWFINHVWYRGL
jgi:hypothetical protein